MSGVFKLGITGAEGFLGGRLAILAGRTPGVAVLKCGRDMWGDLAALTWWVDSCDAVVHFAGLSRHDDGELLYRTNVGLAEKLAAALDGAKHKPRLYLASTTHIDRDLPYHRSKQMSARIFDAAADRNHTASVIMLMPNAFGPGSRPFYNSVVSTFCYLAANGQVPEEIADAKLKLIYGDELAAAILEMVVSGGASRVETIAHRHEVRLPELWRKLVQMAGSPLPPEDADEFEKMLWMTLKSQPCGGKL
ncbi:MAG: NAD-dependent epimerase/dehydratase family protein [Victivallaceae bacterium]|nr:NAD-dependent epimerase/dehydratase family protein [Victivallaceae bacterium]